RAAIATRALGVGAYCVHDRGAIMAHSRGRTGDGRVKPDLGAPTSVYTAGNRSDQQVEQPFGGTSGATPFAAAAALYLKNWMSAGGQMSVFPGEVYAMMLACGDEPRVDERKGTGLVVLPSGGTAWWGRAIVGARQAVTIPLEPPRASAGFEVALWWPEYGRNGAPPAPRERATLALQVASPSGRVATSADPGSVFQRVSLADPPKSNGRWTVTIAGESLPRGAREVYWAAWARPSP
ncbi:MAG: S8 family serine peptidase, partial [Candidatus Eisenbacteria bacterium]|nr:S8 family serine peptidase [Candidatus Eisenbacteria bacterium]